MFMCGCGNVMALFKQQQQQQPTSSPHVCLASGVTRQLVPLTELETYARAHEEMENWLRNYENLGQPASVVEKSRTLTAITDMTVVKEKNLETFVNSQVAVIFSATGMSAEARDKIVADLKQVAISESKDDVFCQIEIEDQVGGTRLMEKFAFKSQKQPDGTYAILTAYYGDKTQLTNNYKWLRGNHDENKIDKWLSFKLFQNVISKMKAVKDSS